jgi:hypothetical protein
MEIGRKQIRILHVSFRFQESTTIIKDSREVVTSVILNALTKARPVIQGLLYPEVWFQNPRPA